MLDQAIEYARHGISVFPCLPRDKRPAVDSWPERATTDEDQIREWWQRWPDANIAIVTGAKSGVVVVDVDGEDGQRSLRELESKHGTMRTAKATTGKGLHLYFSGEGVGNSVRKLGPGLDVRGERGYVIAPPSVHPSGARYEWAEGLSSLAKLPDGLLRSLAKKARKSADVSRIDHATRERHRRYVEAAISGELSELRATREGSRNDRLNVAAYALGTLAHLAPYSESWLTEELFSAAHSIGLVDDDGEHSVRATIRSGFEAGKGEPREIEDDGRPAPVVRPDRPQVADHSWREDLEVTSQGNVAGTDENAILVLLNDPGIRGALAYNERRAMVEWVKQPPFAKHYAHPNRAIPRDFIESDYLRIKTWLANEYGMRKLGKDRIAEIVALTAERKSYDPVRDYLDGLRWDGTPRVDRWLSRYLGAPDEEVYREIGKRWLIAAVARTYEPGCQADNCLVLEGPQGIGKTTALRTLAGKHYQGAKVDPNHKDTERILSAAWIFELQELASVRGRDAESIKAWIGLRDARIRPAYARTEVDIQRRCVFAGSTNEDEYLHDSTGNRRYWPVPCSAVIEGDGLALVDLPGLARDRDQLWAEAAHLYRDGEQWHAQGRVLKALEAIQGERVEVHPWLEEIEEYANGRTEIHISHLLRALDVGTGRQTVSDMRQAGACLRALGWERAKTHSRGRRFWVPGTHRDPCGTHSSEAQNASKPALKPHRTHGTHNYESQETKKLNCNSPFRENPYPMGTMGPDPEECCAHGVHESERCRECDP